MTVIGVLVIIAGLLIFVDIFTTQSSASSAGGGGGVLGAVAGAAETMNMYMEMLMRSAIVTGVSLLLIGFGFIYSDRM